MSGLIAKLGVIHIGGAQVHSNKLIVRASPWTLLNITCDTKRWAALSAPFNLSLMPRVVHCLHLSSFEQLPLE